MSGITYHRQSDNPHLAPILTEPRRWKRQLQAPIPRAPLLPAPDAEPALAHCRRLAMTQHFARLQERELRLQYERELAELEREKRQAGKRKGRPPLERPDRGFAKPAYTRSHDVATRDELRERLETDADTARIVGAACDKFFISRNMPINPGAWTSDFSGGKRPVHTELGTDSCDGTTGTLGGKADVLAAYPHMGTLQIQSTTPRAASRGQDA